MSQRLIGTTFSIKKSSGWANVPFLLVEDSVTIPVDTADAFKLIPLSIPSDWFGLPSPSISFFVNIQGVHIGGGAGGIGLINQVLEGHFTMMGTNILAVFKRSPTNWDLAAAMNIFDPATSGFEWDGFTPLTPIYGSVITIDFQLILMANNPERLKH